MKEDINVKIHNDLIIQNIERETNYAIKCDYDFVHLNVDDVKVLLENYNKQSKEIYQTGYVNGCVSKVYEINKKWKDKIKAKIEEVEQWELYNMKILKLSTLDERLGQKLELNMFCNHF